MMFVGRRAVSHAGVLCKLRLAAAATQTSSFGLFGIVPNVTSSRSYSAATPARLQFCVVGAGPAGFYIADKVLAASPCAITCAHRVVQTASWRCTICQR